MALNLGQRADANWSNRFIKIEETINAAIARKTYSREDLEIPDDLSLDFWASVGSVKNGEGLAVPVAAND